MRFRVPIVVVTMLLVMTGCGDDATTTTTGQTTATTGGGGTSTTAAPGTTTGSTQAPPSELDLDDLTLYLEPADTSYRTTLVFHFIAQTANGVIEGTQLLDGGKLLDPVQYELTGRAEGDATSPMCFAFHTLPTFIDPYDAFLEDGGMLMGTALLSEAGLTVNGRLVDRYEITIDNIDPTDDAGQEVDELTEAHIDIDREYRFVVELVLNGRGRSDLLTGQPTLVGDVDYRLSFSEFGTITELQAPEGC